MSKVISLEQGFVKRNNAKLERIALGYAMTNMLPLADMRQILTDECFYTMRYSKLWRVIEGLADGGETYDMMAVFMWLQQHTDDSTDDAVSFAEIAEMCDEASTSGFASAYAVCDQLYTMMLQRRLIDLGVLAVRYGSTADHGELESHISALRDDVARLLETKGNQTMTLQSVQREVLADVIRMRQEKIECLGTLTGFSFLDESGGLHDSDFIVIAGETSMGKTAFANAIALNAADNGAKICYYTMEMSNKQLGARFISMAEDVSSSNILYKPMALHDHDIDRIQYAIDQHHTENIFLFDRSRNNIRQILVGIRQMHAKHGIRGAIVDYIGMIKGDLQRGQNEASMLNDIARDLKDLAKELGIWIIAISQLSRDDEKRKSHAPSINKLKGSGGIAEAADDVYLVFRPEKRYPGEGFPHPYDHVGLQDVKGRAMILVEKKRNGATGCFLCDFDGPRTLFTENITIKPREERYNSTEPVKMPAKRFSAPVDEEFQQTTTPNEQDKESQPQAQEQELPF